MTKYQIVFEDNSSWDILTEKKPVKIKEIDLKFVADGNEFVKLSDAKSSTENEIVEVETIIDETEIRKEIK